MIRIKTKAEIEKIRTSSKIVAMVLKQAEKEIRPGLTTREMDRKIAKWICDAGGKAAFLGYRGFPASACISINEEVVHGIPGPRKICEGDIVSIDVGVEKEGYFGDGAVTIAVGSVGDEKKRLMDSARRSLVAGIAKARKGFRISDISHAVQSVVEKDGFSAVRALVGHGIGKEVHEDPQIPNYGKPGEGAEIADGMVLAIEPMINAGIYEVFTDSDGWTVVTEDGRPSAHFEHTVAIVNGEPEILTRA